MRGGKQDNLSRASVPEEAQQGGGVMRGRAGVRTDPSVDARKAKCVVRGACLSGEGGEKKRPPPTPHTHTHTPVVMLQITLPQGRKSTRLQRV